MNHPFSSQPRQHYSGQALPFHTRTHSNGSTSMDSSHSFDRRFFDADRKDFRQQPRAGIQTRTTPHHLQAGFSYPDLYQLYNPTNPYINGSGYLDGAISQYIERPPPEPFRTDLDSSFKNPIQSCDIPDTETGHPPGNFRTQLDDIQGADGPPSALSESGPSSLIPKIVSRSETLSLEEISRLFPPQNNLRGLAITIAGQRWFREHHEEPKIQKDEAASKTSDFPGSVFEVFLRMNRPKSFTCKWPDGNGQCAKQFSSRSRARHHVHAHFGYRPFACGGKCAVDGWYGPVILYI
jgi:hypothetical protein